MHDVAATSAHTARDTAPLLIWETHVLLRHVWLKYIC